MLGAYQAKIKALLNESGQQRRKLRYTAHRIYELLVAEDHAALGAPGEDFANVVGAIAGRQDVAGERDEMGAGIDPEDSSTVVVVNDVVVDGRRDGRPLKAWIRPPLTCTTRIPAR